VNTHGYEIIRRDAIAEIADIVVDFLMT